MNYIRRPKLIEIFSNDFIDSLVDINDPQVNELIEILENYIHKDFYVTKLLKKGILYIHGQLPDLIKEYLEHKFNQIDSIQYLVANTVILEGINLPIDTLFILNTFSLNEKELTNLIGRVNRLNYIFSEGAVLEGYYLIFILLIPKNTMAVKVICTTKLKN